MKKLTDRLFGKYCTLVYQESGIKLTEDKRELLNARIGKRLRKQNVTVDDYYTLIQNDPVELREFIDAVSTNHTFFFRESKSFAYLDRGCSEIWCAASSSGEEPYSLAIYCLERGFRPSIRATDISDTCLEKGKKGIYPKKSISTLPNHMLKAYFQKGQGKFQDYIKVKNDVRRMVNFQWFNLIKDTSPRESCDILFCRNVMIYFDKITKEQVVANLVQSLRKGGFFIIGGAESLSGLNHSLTYIEPSVYQKL